MKLLKLPRVGLLLAVILSAVSAHAQIGNAGMENWTGLTGTPPSGDLTWWGNFSGSKATQVNGLAAGSNYSALLRNNSDLVSSVNQGVTLGRGNFTFAYSFALIEPSSTDASFLQLGSVQLRQNLANGSFAATSWIEFRMLTFNNILRLDVRDGVGAAWVTVANNLSYTQYNSTTGVLSNINAYTVSLDYNATANTYSISFGPSGGTMNQVLSNVSYFANPTSGGGISQTYLFGNGNATTALYPIAFDNFSLAPTSAIPEPSSVALIGGLAAIFCIAFVRRRRN